tara:strand:- start:866 stop:1024 length:159 start_codon:yes stop_codon:yes gene_type:complete
MGAIPTAIASPVELIPHTLHPSSVGGGFRRAETTQKVAVRIVYFLFHTYKGA